MKLIFSYKGNKKAIKMLDDDQKYRPQLGEAILLEGNLTFVRHIETKGDAMLIDLTDHRPTEAE